MSILHPQIVQLGKRLYRKNTSNHGYQENVNTSQLAPYVEDDEQNFYEDEPSCQIEEFKGYLNKPFSKN